MRNSSMEAAVRQRFAKLKTTWHERQRRLWAAAEAKSVGYGGVSLVHRATGISRRAIHAGLKELVAVGLFPPRRVRRPGAGRWKLTKIQEGVAEALDALVEPTARGDPQSPLRWTCKSLRQLARALCEQGFRVSREVRKTREIRRISRPLAQKLAHAKMIPCCTRSFRPGRVCRQSFDRQSWCWFGRPCEDSSASSRRFADAGHAGTGGPRAVSKSQGPKATRQIA